MERLKQQLLTLCKVANISIDPDKESLELKEIFTKLRHKGLITEKTLQDIDKVMS